MKELKKFLIIISVVFGVGLAGIFLVNIISDNNSIENTTTSSYSEEKTIKERNTSISTTTTSTTTETTTTTTTTTTSTTTSTETTTSTTTTKATTTTRATTTKNNNSQGRYVWIPNNGEKYHSDPSCSRMKNPSKVTISEAKSAGYTACSKCW